jgi:uncharacterized protein (DUF302 family)
MPHPMKRWAVLAVLISFLALPAAAADWPHPGTESLPSGKSFGQLAEALDSAIKENGMAAVSKASASAGAKRRGIAIPGNLVVGVFRNDFAVRMLDASLEAGIEAPLRFYVTENGDGTATLTYRTPSAVFAPYGSAALDSMAAELDEIFASIARRAVGD